MFRLRSFLFILPALLLPLPAQNPVTVKGPIWTQKNPAATPPITGEQAMAYDRYKGNTVVFGGWNLNSSNPTFPYNGDTWVWDGTNWTLAFSGVTGTYPFCINGDAPSPRIGPAMAYDAGHEQVVLFGGYPCGVTETWIWSGSKWSKRNPTVTPPGRDRHAMAYDPIRKQVVMFGGQGCPDTSSSCNDTWTWNGKNWTQEFPANNPPARLFQGMTFDTARGVTVMFGGQNQVTGSTIFNDTWTWDGQNWTEQFPATSPPPMASPSMAYDAAQKRTILLCSGQQWTASCTDNTWAWDGSNWSVLAPPASPPPASYSAAFDSRLLQVVFFNGTQGTWVWGKP